MAKRGSSRRLRWVVRIAAGLGVAMVIMLVAGALWVRSVLLASLPQLDGSAEVVGLEREVRVRRDQLGVATVSAGSRLDAARATGFLHAQDRFFQMDLLRRSAAGELAELFGPAALEWDRAIRVHRFRSTAADTVAALGTVDRELLTAYVEGVHSGLAALDGPPFEYLLLRVDPQPWRAEDTVLAVLAMFVDLQPEDGAPDATAGLVHDLMGEAWSEFLDPIGGPWDAPVVGEPLPSPPLPPSMPGEGAPVATERDATEAQQLPGSNSWAVAGALTADGGALLANDMHLGLAVPNVWYRLRLEWQDGDTARAVTGVTLPGTPLVVAGSTRTVAWGFTNSYGDFVDLVVLEVDPADPQRYLGPDGWLRLQFHREVIHVKGGGDVVVEVPWTVWGPVIDRDHRGRPRALRWTAHLQDAVNLTAVELESVESVDDALAVAAASGIPAQNFLCADAEGRIGWTIMGRIPGREGCDGRLPVGRECGWRGWVSPEMAPRLVDPADGLLWTANARVVDGPALAVLGDGGYALGARAAQIRDSLRAGAGFTEADMLEIQLDDRALFLSRWRELLLELLDRDAVARDPLRETARDRVESWGGRASVDSVGYRLVREFRRAVHDELLGSYTAAAAAADPEFRAWRLGRAEAAVWRLAVERPPHLLPAGASSWRSLLLDVFDIVLGDLVQRHGALDAATWGARNTVRIRHPLSRAVPLLDAWLDMPEVQLPGDALMPRVQSPGFGASQRMVVSPGREEHGIFHMPCGQSGHPLSPFYRAGHDAWVRGEPAPFLPGPPIYELSLEPPRGAVDHAPLRP